MSRCERSCWHTHTHPHTHTHTHTQGERVTVYWHGRCARSTPSITVSRPKLIEGAGMQQLSFHCSAAERDNRIGTDKTATPRQRIQLVGSTLFFSFSLKHTHTHTQRQQLPLDHFGFQKYICLLRGRGPKRGEGIIGRNGKFSTRLCQRSRPSSETKTQI